ncbi:hypothetical protein L2E82_21096 [Cichorium intybus]|uniref:Uncharacterized protein n=1 Tax=Cichorium intybus TaxID=13427 RepID=A0ACB9DUP6_CICIN|nr:hypothetical protein L2E82_21096 [Cichorium intybus]
MSVLSSPEFITVAANNNRTTPLIHQQITTAWFYGTIDVILEFYTGAVFSTALVQLKSKLPLYTAIAAKDEISFTKTFIEIVRFAFNFPHQFDRVDLLVKVLLKNDSKSLLLYLSICSLFPIRDAMLAVAGLKALVIGFISNEIALRMALFVTLLAAMVAGVDWEKFIVAVSANWLA